MSVVLGITGGIATGKSTVVNIFRALGFPIVDGDNVAREIVEAGKAGLSAIIETFGETMLTEDGQLNRKKLGDLIFSDAQKRKQLDQILDPHLREGIRDGIEKAAQAADLVVVDIPLLFEANYEEDVDLIAVVYVPQSVQVNRLMQRNHLTEDAALQRIASQLPIDAKKEWADIVFDNQGTIEETKKQVELWLSRQGFLKKG